MLSICGGQMKYAKTLYWQHSLIVKVNSFFNCQGLFAQKNEDRKKTIIFTCPFSLFCPVRTSSTKSQHGKNDGKKGLHSVAARSEIAWHLFLHANMLNSIIESCGPQQCDVPSLFLVSVTVYGCLVRQEQVLEMLQHSNEEPSVKDNNERWGVASR